MYYRNAFPDGTDGFETLVEIALDMHWSWNHASDFIWQYLDKDYWQITQNPWNLLQTVSRKKVEGALADPEFSSKLSNFMELRKKSKHKSFWFENNYPKSALQCVAYFSMEFMLSEALPIYSGGLGNVAGDHLKGASDLGVPIIGIGLLYQQGYFRQNINDEGDQQVSLPFNDPNQLPITPLFNQDGDWLRVKIEIADQTVWLRTWKVQVGNRVLYLLDSNDPVNFPPYRCITNELYDADSDVRLMQEIILGIGGWRLLTMLGLKPDICHLNEGHAAFATLERAHVLMQELNVSFDTALTITRAGNIFTTHTSVEASFDKFSPQKIDFYLGKYLREHLHITLDDFLLLGRKNTASTDEHFNMAFFAIRTSAFVNGVSRLHGQVSRQLFSALFPGWPIDEVPIGHVTNGVHMPSWDSAAADKLWTDLCQKTRWLGSADVLENKIRTITNEELWAFRNDARSAFLEFLRIRLCDKKSFEKTSIETNNVHGVGGVSTKPGARFFDKNILTIGFARRFAEYKRPNLLLQDPERLIKLLTNHEHPVRLIIAGKAHPKDVAGQELIRQWHDFIRRPGLSDHVIFLNDYDMLLAAQIVQGVDVWLNTPQRPWEACGTSGMKVLVNGGINLSELDGWWAEAFSPELGWALGDELEHGNDPFWNGTEAEMLYELLEHQVIPEFYRRNSENIPIAWVTRMRESMAQLTPKFSVNRSLKEYIDNYYVPAATKYRKYSMNKGSEGKSSTRLLNDWKITSKNLHFGHFHAEKRNNENYFEIEVYIDNVDANSVKVELYADGLNGFRAEKYEMHREVNTKRNKNGCEIFYVATSATRPLNDYTARLFLATEDIRAPADTGYILWQK